MDKPRIIIQYDDADTFIYQPTHISKFNIPYKKDGEPYGVQISIDNHLIHLYHQDQDILEDIKNKLYDYIKRSIATPRKEPICIDSHTIFSSPNKDYILEEFDSNYGISVVWTEIKK